MAWREACTKVSSSFSSNIASHGLGMSAASSPTTALTRWKLLKTASCTTRCELGFMGLPMRLSRVSMPCRSIASTTCPRVSSVPPTKLRSRKSSRRPQVPAPFSRAPVKCRSPAPASPTPLSLSRDSAGLEPATAASSATQASSYASLRRTRFCSAIAASFFSSSSLSAASQSRRIAWELRRRRLTALRPLLFLSPFSSLASSASSSNFGPSFSLMRTTS
mmetsp:Transcript_49286/g.157847  ORF Transcript_49286/g.157847 Transcript_49286/m.157847 type:complete len:220 (-) Transcript_49286:2993-3652(-)